MIEGKTARLRSVELSDVDEFVESWNNMELRNLLGAAALDTMSRGEEEEWFGVHGKTNGKEQGLFS